MNGKIMLNGKAYSSSGRPSREVTMAEWLALPDTKYTDGIIYYVKDIGGANQFPPLIYSLEEREVGVWTDGKPLYQKTYEVTSVVFGGVTNNNNLLLTPEIEVKHYEGYILRSNNRLDGFIKGFHDSLNSVTENQNISQMTIRKQSASPNNTIIQFSVASSLQPDFQKVIITIQYTKSTDAAGSGTWTIDGTYAHHYSANEKVIGTWIDGKPLYERVFGINIIPSNLPSNYLSQYNVKSVKWGYIHTWAGNQEILSEKFAYNTYTKEFTSTEYNWSDFMYLQYTKTTD